MIIVFFYIVLLCLAVMGVLAIVCFFIALWMIAVLIDLIVMGTRLVRGQRGDELWRDPFSVRLVHRSPKKIPQAAYSNRR